MKLLDYAYQRIPLLLIVGIVFGLLGCTSQQPSEPGESELSDQLTGTLPWSGGMAEECFIAGYSAAYRPIDCTVFTDSESHDENLPGHRTVMLIGCIHGDEPAGFTLLRRLELALRSGPTGCVNRTVVIVPNLNPDGVIAGRRTNFRGVDLNRNFNSTNWSKRARDRHGTSPLSEPESQLLVDLIDFFKPDCIVSIHQPIRCIDFDGPDDARQIADVMSTAIGGELPARKLGSLPGSLGSWAGIDRGIPTITVELPRYAHQIDEEELWERYGPMLLAAIQWE